MPGTRRSHRKSRNGCIPCKQRKIKCDEAKPSCQTCIRHMHDCQYADAKPKPLASDMHSDSASSTPQPSSSLPPLAVSSWGWDISDLELLHFYTTSTSWTISSLPKSQQIWQQSIPHIAFAHDFLLHAMLAVAALHLSRFAPARKDRLYMEASRHHDVAVRAFRVAISDVNEQSCHACFAAAIFIFIYARVTPDKNSSLFFRDVSCPSDQGMTVEWVHLLRGAGKACSEYVDVLQRGPLASLIYLWDDSDIPLAFARTDDIAKLDALKQLWSPVSASFNATETESLQTTLDILKEIYGMMSELGNNLDCVSAALSWPIRVPEVYIEMVARRDPEALVLLAHFSLLLNKIGDSWWLEGLSRELLETIYKTLPESWQGRIDWPLQDLVLCEFREKCRKK